MNPYLLPHANIQWQIDSTPFAPDYGDIYWSTAGGLEEKIHTFIEGCDLPNRWQQMTAAHRFTVAELGFGFGLNFLLTLRAWQNSKEAQGNCKLHFVSFEKHLVPFSEILKLAEHFGLGSEARLLQELYPPPVPGPHVIHLTESCTLTLVVGDISEVPKSLDGSLDALFLDGFSPSKNQMMWQPAAIRAFVKRLRQGGTVSTYSVAGALRRQLEAEGLIVEKAPGFGAKRHMLKASVPGQWSPQQVGGKNIAVIGAGLSGLNVARALEQRNYQVTVYDRSGQAYGAVKDIQQIAVYPQLSQSPQPYSNLYLRSFLYFVRHHEYQGCGRLELLDSEQKLERARQLAKQLPGILSLKTPTECSELLGFKVPHSGLFNQYAGWMSPQKVEPQRAVVPQELQGLTPADGGWKLTFDQSETQFDAVILTTGPAQLEHLSPLDLMPLRGQSLRVLAPAPDCVLSAGKTWFPANSQGLSTISGTYDRFDSDLSIREEDSKTLLAGIPISPPPSEYSAQVGIRTATRDRLPVVGKLPDWDKLKAALTSNPSMDRNVFTDYLPGLYCAVGFGSHAGTLGPYCSELLAAEISGELQTENTAQLCSIRFALRDGGL